MNFIKNVSNRGYLHEMSKPVFWEKEEKYFSMPGAENFAQQSAEASVAQLDAHPTGDQEVMGSTPAKVGNILSWRLIMKYFLWSFSPFH